MTVTEKTFRRAELASLAGLLLQSAGTLLVLLLGMANNSPAVWAEGWHWLGGVPIWGLLLLVFHQKRLEALERLELDELRRQREEAGQTALFEVEAEDLLVAGRRLRTILRYVLPIVTVALAGYHIVFGLILWRVAGWAAPLEAEELPEISHQGLSMALLSGAAFLAFLLSRLAMGMAKTSEWRMLRTGGSYLTGNCLATGTAVAVLAMAYFGYRTPELILAWILPVLLIVLGVEMVFNLVLEMYRPRVPGTEPRPAIDSRLLGLISEPGDVARSIADAVNYQFGFEVSKTWFYQLLQKALGPLVLFQLAALLALSCLVIVEPGERAVIERFGRRRSENLQAGLHFKWPWPIEQAHVVQADRIREFVLGAHAGEGEALHEEGEVVLWTQEHHLGHKEEYDILVAPPQIATALQERRIMQVEGAPERGAATSVPVNLLRIVALVRYRVSEPTEFLYNYSDPEAVLKAITEEAFLKFAASHDSDQLMSAERRRVNESLRADLEKRLASMDPPLGVELVYAGLLGVHPPPAVAEAYEAVGGAEMEFKSMVRAARAYENQVLGSLVGDVELAQALAQAIDKALRAGAESPGDEPPDVQAARKRLTDLLHRVGGEVAKMISAAEADRVERENAVLGDVARWDAQLRAYKLAPQLYTASAYLDILARVLKPVRKYLIAAKTEGRPFVVEFDVKEEAGLFEITPGGESGSSQ